MKEVMEPTYMVRDSGRVRVTIDIRCVTNRFSSCFGHSMHLIVLVILDFFSPNICFVNGDVCALIFKKVLFYAWFV